MPLKLNVGVSRKVGRPDYGSAGASCHLEVELDAGLLDDLDAFHARVRHAYVAARQAVVDELARLHDPAPEPVAGSSPAAASTGSAPRNTTSPAARPPTGRFRPGRAPREADGARRPRRGRSGRWSPWPAARAPTSTASSATASASCGPRTCRWPRPRSSLINSGPTPRSDRDPGLSVRTSQRQEGPIAHDQSPPPGRRRARIAGRRPRRPRRAVRRDATADGDDGRTDRSPDDRVNPVDRPVAARDDRAVGPLGRRRRDVPRPASARATPPPPSTDAGAETPWEPVRN